MIKEESFMNNLKKDAVTAIVPVFNEEDTILIVLKNLLDIDLINQIIVIDDASRDNTVNNIKKLSDDKLFLIENSQNLGKGATIRQALKYITSEFVCVQDADLELNPSYIKNYFEIAVKDNLDVVFGSRFKNLRIEGYPIKLSLANKLYTLIINFLTKHNFEDVNCGHKFFRTNVLKDLKFKENHFGADPEISYLVGRKKLKHIDYQIAFKARGKKQGKKITWIDGLKFFKVIYKTHKNYK